MPKLSRVWCTLILVGTRLVVSAAKTHINSQTVANQETILPNAPYSQETIQPTTLDATSIGNFNVQISLQIKVSFFIIMLSLSQPI